MSMAGFLLASSFGLPLFLALAIAIWPRLRPRALDLLIPAPLPGLLSALLVPTGQVAVSPPPLRMVLMLDTSGALLLGGASLLWLGAGFYARAYMAGATRPARFAVWWLMTLAGSLAVFLVADLASFYLAFALASLPAYGLVTQEGSARAGRAGFHYMALAMVGEAVLLLAFVVLAQGASGNPLISDAVSRLSGLPHANLILFLLVIGFGIKMGLAPLHVWMPLAHPVAPMPASAVLSGIVVKAGVIGLVRFLPLDVAWPLAGLALSALGLFTAFYAAGVGLTQQHPKTVLAYSTVSQMGLIAAILGSGLAAGIPSVGPIAAFYALHHMLVKGALFMGVGLIVAQWRKQWVFWVVMALLGLSLAGLPFTSGALAKYAAKSVMGSDWVAGFATLTATGSTMLMLHFLHCLNRSAMAGGGGRSNGALVLPWSLVAAASVLVPWAVMGPAIGLFPAATLSMKALWSAVWPMLIGGGLYGLLRLSGWSLPTLPEGDVIAFFERGAPYLRTLVDRITFLEARLREWPVATGLLVVFVLSLAAALAT
jgi:formate hydrogenlyase subunit 3/multisubunit Na+/H+ antiporter MnhD subunit